MTFCPSEDLQLTDSVPNVHGCGSSHAELYNIYRTVQNRKLSRHLQKNGTWHHPVPSRIHNEIPDSNPSTHFSNHLPRRYVHCFLHQTAGRWVSDYKSLFCQTGHYALLTSFVLLPKFSIFAVCLHLPCLIGSSQRTISHGRQYPVRGDDSHHLYWAGLCPRPLFT